MAVMNMHKGMRLKTEIAQKAKAKYERNLRIPQWDLPKNKSNSW